ncbi:RNA demethylase ALKBH9B-like isoform X1 [Camellia sinensis]|uniref:RNA demethylase ALKBH9B-like isoform X1 n=1 Tax=Camellia sinensis TaxID=4442 RepID=UPI001036A1D2|nr:RNA demethylase ALKBH9B-like isoform X1 [Camellia sinensis]
MNGEEGAPREDPLLVKYNANDLRIASEFLSIWLPFLSRGLCLHCSHTLSARIRSLPSEVDEAVEPPLKQEENLTLSTLDNLDPNEFNENQDSCDTNSLGKGKVLSDMNDTADTSSLGSWKDGAENDWSEHVTEALTSETVGSPAVPVESPRVQMSWADMAEEDELEEYEETQVSLQTVNGHALSREESVAVKVRQREYIRFSSVDRKKDFICLERVQGKIVNILKGLELHTGVFNDAEQKKIVDYVYKLQEMGKKGELKERTYTAPQKWMKGKGRVTIQFGCCYNYATDKNGNPPGILQNITVDPIPLLFKMIIRRLVRWHVLPPTCVPDSCIVNIYEEGDCIPPHIDNHDFVRPFCTVSFLSECDLLFGSDLKVVDAGEFSGCIAIPLPIGSVFVLNGNGADVAKHCVPAVPTKRISITFRKMDESKRPIGFVPEPDLQGLQPISYETDRSKRPTLSKSKRSVNSQPARREDSRDKARRSAGRGNNYLNPPISLQIQCGPSNRRTVRVNWDA